MDLRHLRYFVAVADHGSLAAAADVVAVTQPALSRQIHLLERRLGVVLFTKPSRRLELTPAGREFLPVARDVLARADAAEAVGRSLAQGHLASVTIAAPSTTLTDVIAPFVATFGPDDPEPTVVEADSTEALDLLARTVDLAIVTRTPPRHLGSHPIARLPLWAYVRPDDEWGARSDVRLAELADRPLVLLDTGFRARQLLDEALEAAGLAAGEHIECGNPQVAQALSAAGRGVSVVSDDPRFDLHGLRILAAGKPLTLSLVAAWRPDHHASATLADLAVRLADFTTARYAAVPH
ncbi:LysR family transcriptional regulator [Knoellia koreensis]|uniref:LysR family transcriptional regulator n=1 Tax=Knoellia koreensis TaxID=2730921 RepID=A0A849HIP9_9MICO|nr:LysR family transcriptional regulator [Knoellia sp. DB2414S]NNM47805.1 LysR family transcriptional regulator [Knoellia sp. DB2414S]